MSQSDPPNPQSYRSLGEWAQALYQSLTTDTRFRARNEPLPILLPHRTENRDERATTPGIVLYDPVYQCVVVSENGGWVPLTEQAKFELSYERPAGNNGGNIAITGTAVPYNVASVDDAPWATFNSGTNDFTLMQGTYAIEGFVSISKVSGGLKTFTGFLAETSDLTTAVGTVRMGTFSMATDAAASTAGVIPFRGTVTVPSGGGTYSMVVAGTADTRLGRGHNITGYDNTFSKLSVALKGLNGA